MSREKYFKHGRLKAHILNVWTTIIPRMAPIESVQSIRQVSSRYGFQCQTRPSTTAGMVWVFIRPNKKAGRVSPTGLSSVSPLS